MLNPSSTIRAVYLVTQVAAQIVYWVMMTRVIRFGPMGRMGLTGVTGLIGRTGVTGRTGRTMGLRMIPPFCASSG